MDDEELRALRAEIDAIDDQLLALIERRLAASGAVALAKGKEAGHRLKLRPRRQADVIERLQGRARRTPREAVAAVWRELMGHGLQAQAPTLILLAGGGDRALIEAWTRAHFGSAPPILHVASAAEALRRAREEEAVAVLAGPLPDSVHGLTLFDILRSPDGAPFAYAIGRVAAEDAAWSGRPARPRAVAAAPRGARAWSPAGWRERRALQMPVWPDAPALAEVEARLAVTPPLVPFAEVAALKAELAEVAAGRAFLLQGGDCAESFAEFGPEKVRRDQRLLIGMGALVSGVAGRPVVHVARAAGQYAKPRSRGAETAHGVTLPAYRGDAVNGRVFSPATRAADPQRLIEAHRLSRATLDLLAAYDAADPGQARVYASHEALLLNYEQALTRQDPETGRWWAGSGHMVWIGERTRGLDDAHVEFARGIANPIGLKCGPSLTPDALLRLIERLDPDNEPGRLVLIGRFGAAAAPRALPPLMRAVRAEGRRAIWLCDPMHGNGRSAGGVKTRRVGDILSEVSAFVATAAEQLVYPGGLHLEMTGSDVTECLGGTCAVAERDLPRRYLSACDPRLNPSQAAEVAAAFAQAAGAAKQPRSDAA